jgi:hypothetical protein
MQYEKIQAACVEIMLEEDPFKKLKTRSETFKQPELFILGAMIGAGFGDREAAAKFLAYISSNADVPYDTYTGFHDRVSRAISAADLTSLLESEPFEIVLLGMTFGSGFSPNKGIPAVAALSEVFGISYSGNEPRADYRAPVPEWIFADNLPEC